MNYPLVSCVITSYNKIDCLYEAIDSVLAQDYPRIELLLTDDFSPAFDMKVFSDYIEKNKKNNIVRYIVYKQAQNVGTVKNTNTMMKIATGDFFVGIDGDDVFYDSSVITRIINRFQQTGADYLACSRLKCTEDLSPIGLFPTEEQRNSFSELRTWEKQLGAFCVFDFMEIDAHVFSRRVLNELGLYDERFRQWQDGPRLTEYVRKGHTIVPAFDITYIKYRQGGVSNKPSSNTQSASYLKNDKDLFISLYTIPNKLYCNSQKFRRTLFWYELGKKTSTLKKLLIALKFPKETFLLMMRK